MDTGRARETFLLIRQRPKEDRHAIRRRAPNPAHPRVVRQNRPVGLPRKYLPPARCRETFLGETTDLERRRRARLSDRTNRNRVSFASANTQRRPIFPKAKSRGA